MAKPIKDKKHLARVAEMPCCCCGRQPVQVHHLLRGGNRGMGIKNGDDMTIPLCPFHHATLHNDGNKSLDETEFLAIHGVNGPRLAARLWSESNS